ncbi:MAG: S9 family peptidase [Caulobacter sp.]|nr:S9 family peptidase [Caulobacter sp.]
MRSLALAGAVLALYAGTVDARPYTVEDLLDTEAVGAAGFDPTGHWLVVERRGALRAAPAFDGAELSHRLATDLWLMDTTAPSPRPIVLRRPADTGLIAGPFSQDGARLAVIGVTGKDARLGIVKLGATQAQWLEATPNWTMHGQALIWRSPHQLLAIIDNAPGLPAGFRSDAAADRAAMVLSARAWRGEVSATINGSGRWTSGPHRLSQSLVSIDMATGRTTVLTQGDFDDMEMSASGRYVALFNRVGDRPPRPGEAFRGGEALVRRELRIVDLATGAVVDPCPGRDLAVLTLRWSPVVDELLVLDQAPRDAVAPEALRVTATGEVARLAPKGLEAVPTVTLLVASVGAIWVGAEPALWAVRSGETRADWYLLTRDGPRNLTAAWAAAPSMPIAVAPEGLLFAAGAGVELLDRDGRRQMLDGIPPQPSAGAGARRHFDPPQIALSDLARPSRNPPGVELLAEGSRSALFSVSSRQGATLELRRDDGAFAVTRLNEHLADVDLASAEPIVENGLSGPVTHWLYRPEIPGLAPLIVMPYPGVAYDAPPAPGSGQVLATMTNIQVMVGAGYAVLVPSLPPLPGGADPAAITAQVDRAVSATIAAGGVDPDRMAVWGHSFGGYATLAIATQSSRYKAYVASASVADMATAWGRFSRTQSASPATGLSLAGAGWAENGQAGLGVPPWAASSGYVAASPLYAADRITRPVLLIHGDADTLPLDQAEALFTALQRQGKDAQLVTYFGEGHVFGSPGNIRDLYGRVLGFLAITLPSQPARLSVAGPASPPNP